MVHEVEYIQYHLQRSLLLLFHTIQPTPTYLPTYPPYQVPLCVHGAANLEQIAVSHRYQHNRDEQWQPTPTYHGLQNFHEVYTSRPPWTNFRA